MRKFLGRAILLAVMLVCASVSLEANIYPVWEPYVAEFLVSLGLAGN